MDQRLKKSKADLLRAQKLAKVGNWEWDIKTGRVEWSDVLFDIFGVDKQEPSYELARSLTHPDDTQKHRSSFVPATVIKYHGKQQDKSASKHSSISP